MIGWIILAAIVLLIFVISLIRLGGRAKYDGNGFYAYVLAGPVKIQLYPAKPRDEEKQKKKKPKKEKTKKEKPKKAEDSPEKKPGTLGRVLELLPVVGEAAGSLKRKIRIDHLILTVIWGAEDAASAALGYGKANAFLGMIWPLIDHNFKVKKCDWNMDVDYGKQKPEFAADAAITITVGQLVSFAFYYGIKLLTNWSRSGKRSAKQKEASL